MNVVDYVKEIVLWPWTKEPESPDALNPLIKEKMISQPVPTGSSLVKGVYAQDKDYVCLGLVSSYDFESFGWALKEESGPHENGYPEDSEFRVFHKDGVDLLVCYCEKLYHKFCIATELMKKYQLTKKSDRIQLFQAILYGNWMESE